jgi:hypothetical protein
MKTIIFLFSLLFFFNLAHAANCNSYLIVTTDTIPKKSEIINSKNEKLYCSDFAKTKYKLLIAGTKIKITRLYKEYVDHYTGILKNGKIYSNDPNEKNLKDVWGRYYKLDGKNFGVLNIENGDYDWFVECKQ